MASLSFLKWSSIENRFASKDVKLKRKSINKTSEICNQTILHKYEVRKGTNASTENFKRIKKEKGINNYEIHKRSGVLELTLSEFERGKHRDLRISTLIKIADALNVSLDELVGRKRK